MKIIIAGAGDVGVHLAKLLADEQHDIIIVDLNKKRLERIDNELDVITLVGSSIGASTLRNAGVEEADLLIAVTESESTNITTGVIAKKLGAKRCIIRINNEEFLTDTSGFTLESLGIDSIISPPHLVTNEIVELLAQTGLTDSIIFADGKLKVIGVHLLDRSAPIIDKNVVEAAKVDSSPLMPVAIKRKGKTIIPKGNTIFRYDDFAYFVCRVEDFSLLMKLTGKNHVKPKNVMIVGGSQIGYQSAKLLSSKYNVKLIEQRKSKCYDFADELCKTLVIHGDARNVSLLREENIEEMDAFIAVTGNSETNIMSCLVAKSLGVKQTIALVENIDYINLSQDIGIDTLLNKKLIAASNIFKYVREGAVLAVGTLHGVESEILEFVAKENALVTQKAIRDLKLPKTAVIGGVMRGDETYIPLGNFEIKAEDRVVVFTLPDAIQKVEKLFK